MRQKFSLRMLVEEVEYEIGQRRSVYERIAKTQPRRKSELDYHMSRMEAVRDFLVECLRAENG